MSINEKESRSESDDRAIQVTNCTIYVGHVRIVIDPRLNADVTGIAEIRATQDHVGPNVNTQPKQTNFVGIRSTKPRNQRQPITTSCAARPKTTKVGPTSRQSVCLRTATSQLSCCLHGGGRCNYEARFGTGSNNYITGTDNFNAPVKNGYPSRKNISRRSPIWVTQNGGRLSPLRLVSRDQSVVISDRSTPPRTLVPFSSQSKPPSRQDRPVDLYSGSKLPVPIRPAPVTVRIPRINRTGDGLLLSLNNCQNERRCATADISLLTDDGLNDRRCATADRPLETNDRPHDTDDRTHDTDDRPQDIDDRQNDINDGQHDTDDRLHDVIDLLDYDDMAVVPRQQCVRIDESASTSKSEQCCHFQALDDLGLMDSQPVLVNSDSLSDAPDHPTLQLISQNKFGDQCVSLFPDDVLT